MNTFITNDYCYFFSNLMNHRYMCYFLCFDIFEYYLSYEKVSKHVKDCSLKTRNYSTTAFTCHTFIIFLTPFLVSRVSSTTVAFVDYTYFSFLNSDHVY